MTELMRAIGVLREYYLNQVRVSEEYHIDNEEYLTGLYDSVRILEKIRDKEIDLEFRYYEETTEQTSDAN